MLIISTKTSMGTSLWVWLAERLVRFGFLQAVWVREGKVFLEGEREREKRLSHKH